jgi:hypothetical protein
MYHELRWVERPAPASEPPRVVLARDLAGAAERPTDVCWFWQPGGATLREELERNHRELLELVRRLEEYGSGPRLWLVTRGAQLLPGDPPGDESAPTPASA